MGCSLLDARYFVDTNTKVNSSHSVAQFGLTGMKLLIRGIGGLCVPINYFLQVLHDVGPIIVFIYFGYRKLRKLPSTHELFSDVIKLLF
jgi:hypothetical protein